jgi:anti-anti-sigma regulatory factor
MKKSHQITPSQPVNTASLGASAIEFLECLQNASGSTSLEIDLSSTETPDSGTIKFLLAAANDCRQRGISPGVRATGKTAELLRLLNMDQHLALNTGEVSK